MAKRLSSEASPPASLQSQTSDSIQCTCGNILPSDAVRCPICLEPGRKHPSRQTYSLSSRPVRHLTPPPSQAGSPRQSSEQTERPSAYPRPRASYTANALSNSYASEDGGAAFFPPTLYTRNSSLDSARRSSSSLSALAESSGGSSRRTSSVTPSRSSGTVPSPSLNDPLATATEYAPMAGAFARLRAKDSPSSSGPGRPGRARPSTDLGARMFAGAP